MQSLGCEEARKTTGPDAKGDRKWGRVWRGREAATAKEKQKRATAKILGPWLRALPQILRVERGVVVSGESEGEGEAECVVGRGIHWNTTQPAKAPKWKKEQRAECRFLAFLLM